MGLSDTGNQISLPDAIPLPPQETVIATFTDFQHMATYPYRPKSAIDLQFVMLNSFQHLAGQQKYQIPKQVRNDGQSNR